MRHGSLFSGVGGFDLAAERMGWKIVFQVEIDSFCQKILKYYWPNVTSYGDIREFDGTRYGGLIDIISAGVPCQPASVAGKRKGEDDDRWLWPEMLRVISEIKPPFVVCENPPGILSLGHGKPFASILSALEDEGYQTELFVIPACGIQAPHKRDRVWIIAYSICTASGIESRKISDKGRGTNEDRGESIRQIHRKACTSRIDSASGTSPDSIIRGEFCLSRESGKITPHNSNIRNNGSEWNATDTKEQRLQKRNGKQIWDKTHTTTERYNSIPDWQNFPTQSPLCCRDDGVSSGLDGITFSKWRNESIKAYGNAIVPQVAYEIFKAIEYYDNHATDQTAKGAERQAQD